MMEKYILVILKKRKNGDMVFVYLKMVKNCMKVNLLIIRKRGME
jgi:hypothetical protein